MARMPHAAKVLRNLLNDKLRRSLDGKGAETMVPTDEPDGLNTHRTFDLDGPASKIVAGMVAGGWSDRRIAEAKVGGTKKDPKVTITFVSGIAADDRDPFPVDGVDAPEEESTEQT